MNDVGKESVGKKRASRPRREEVKRGRSTSKHMEEILPVVGAGKAEALRKSGIDILGERSWGTHLCQFYQTKQDLTDILVPYFKAGLENNEFCMWITSEPLNAQDAKKALKRKVKNLDAYIKKGQIEILDYSDGYTKTGEFEADSVLQGWVEKHDQAIKRGFAGLRFAGNTFWLEKKDWAKFTDYEAVVNNVIGKYKMLAICTYSLDKCRASEVIDVVNNHQLALIRREDRWELIESSERKQARERIIQLNASLAAIQNVNQLITSEKSPEQVLQGVCNILVCTRGYDSAWIAMFDENGGLLAAAEAGLGEAFAKIIDLLNRRRLSKRGRKMLSQPSIVATEEPFSIFAESFLLDSYADKGTMTTRLEYGGKVYGMLSVCLPASFITSKEEQSLFEQVAEDIGFALHGMELDKQRKQAEQELITRNEELERFNKLAVGREFRIIELKKEINDLLKKLGKEARYNIPG